MEDRPPVTKADQLINGSGKLHAQRSGHGLIFCQNQPSVNRSLSIVRTDPFTFSPAGTTENSPAIHRWESGWIGPESRRDARNLTLQPVAGCLKVLSSLRDSRATPIHPPALKRWAMVFRPPGLGKAHSTGNSEEPIVAADVKRL